jgi:hypothetical protein
MALGKGINALNFHTFFPLPSRERLGYDELNSYNSIVYKKLPLKGTFCSFSLRERAGVRGKRYFG